jgi:hypothetical protein
MTSILNRILNTVWFAMVLALFLPFSLHAQTESLTLSVSPTLFDMTATPGQEWVSTIKVINSNPFDISIYSDVVNFEPQGETGHSKFIPILEGETSGHTLAEWVKLEQEEFVVPAEKTAEVTFRITVPTDASPGGHFGAILIGTKSLGVGGEQTIVETSQVVTSLIFLRVTGDIVEDGAIREFRSTQYLSERPHMDFELRFQNKGNVHILPQGEIRIFNMWGQERGVIPVNKHTLFGNVLPESVRKYSFSWTGEWSLADIGRYRAVATLAYGQEDRKFASSETSFWVLPWKIVGFTLLIIVAFIMFMTWAIKLYVRKMLALAGVSPDQHDHSPTSRQRRVEKVSVIAPIEEGILDLRQRFNTSDTWQERSGDIFAFIARYKIFFLALIVTSLFAAATVWYVRTASVSERPYEVVIDGLGNDVQISSEQLEYESRKEEDADQNSASTTAKEFPSIKIINQSGVSGLGAELRLQLESAGYPVVELANELDKQEPNTVIVYAPEFDSEALELSGQVFGALTSAYAEASGTETPIIIYIGKDLENAVQ